MIKPILRKFACFGAVLLLALVSCLILVGLTLTSAGAQEYDAANNNLVSGYFPVIPRGAGDEVLPQLVPVVSNAPLEVTHPGVTRAVIIIHDYTRDANAHAAMMASLAGAANADSFIIAPQFMQDVDIVRAGNLPPDQKKILAHWPLDGWIYGGDSLATPPQKSISSFTALDLLLMYLGSNNFFPDLQTITIAGHGMGGDFVQRYAALGQAPALLQKQNIGVRYLVADAASYLYFTAPRFLIAKEGARPSLGTPDAAQCASWNNYPYGLEQLNAYAKNAGATAAKLDYTAKNITYLVAENIDAVDPILDRSCAAMLQAPNRLMRFQAYQKYLTVTFGDAAQNTQQFMTVPKAGYEPAALFGSSCGLAVLFGGGECY